MEDRIQSGIYHPNNFNCRTYWKYKDGADEVPQEPETKKAQYEIDVFDEGFGKKLRIRLFSRVGKDPEHKRDFYSYLEFPLDSNFADALGEFLERKDDYYNTVNT